MTARAAHVYLESSAALRDLLDGEGADTVRTALRDAGVVATSRLTLAEVSRVMTRLRVLEPRAGAAAGPREAQFQSDAELWAVQPVDEAIWERAGRPFPHEPVRIMDAIHLATMEKLSGALTRMTVLSTDERVRQNARALGFDVLP